MPDKARVCLNNVSIYVNVLITLNIIEYNDICLKKQSAEYAGILNVSDAVHSKRSLHKLLSSY